MRSFLLILSFFFTLLCFAGNDPDLKPDLLNASPDSSKVYRQRRTTLALAGVTAYAGTMTGLYNLWYRDYPQTHFHFFNDNDEWLGVDKLGHATTSYYVGRLGYDAWKWAGMSEKKATWIGGLSGFFFLTTIEILDGFSAQWGASSGDLTANTVGSALFISQQLAWHDQKIMLKWSYHSTDFPDYRPDLLGRNFAERMGKDYNGHTYWLSANLHSFAGKHSVIPRWLNVALGYGATGMTGASSNKTEYLEKPIPSFERRQLFYIAPDIDLTHIRTQSATLKWIFEAIGFLKFPLPALEISKQGIRFKPLCF